MISARFQAAFRPTAAFLCDKDLADYANHIHQMEEKMTRFFYATALAALFTAPAAMADQYMVQIDQPFEGASNGLLETLRITEIDRFAHDGAHFIVIEAPDAGYVEAYFFAISRTPITLHTIEADWTAPGLSSLPMEQRLPFLNTAQCGFCLS